MDQRIIDKAVRQWRTRLRACIVGLRYVKPINKRILYCIVLYCIKLKADTLNVIAPVMCFANGTVLTTRHMC